MGLAVEDPQIEPEHDENEAKKPDPGCGIFHEE
jgi:hypothetical protein